MGAMATPKVDPAQTPTIDDAPAVDPVLGWVIIAWNDPVNLMSYVTWVLQKLFGYEHDKAEQLMLDIHHKGRAMVAYGPRERMEHDASRLHRYGLWATVDRS
jgi:ATP-dependent Clp protease adaptor protein ClpS